MSERTLSVLDGSTFVLGDRLGDLRPDGGREHGFFSDDTRFVSRWVLRLDETPLELLSLNQSAHFDAQFFLTPAVGPEEEPPCSIVRHRLVGEVWMERLIVTNHLHEPSRLRLALDVDTDFADLFEVKDGLVAERDVTCSHDDASLTLGYVRGDFRRSVTITASLPGAVSRHGFAFTLELAHGEQWSVDLAVSPHAAQPGLTFARPRAPRRPRVPAAGEICRARDVAGPSAGVGGRRSRAHAHLPREPQRSSGLINQCWKDSWNAIQFADGRLAQGPIATCEIPGYVYDAQRRCARLAREVWGDGMLAERLEQRAGDLRDNFRRDFWIHDRGCHALALDGNKRQVDSLTYNIGHLLWSGILDDREARHHRRAATRRRAVVRLGGPNPRRT